MIKLVADRDYKKGYGKGYEASYLKTYPLAPITICMHTVFLIYLESLALPTTLPQRHGRVVGSATR